MEFQVNLLLETTLSLLHQASRNSVRHMVSNVLQLVLTISKRVYQKERADGEEFVTESGSDPHLAMLCLQKTPINHHLLSPAEMLNARTYQSNLPSLSKPTKPTFPKIDDETTAKLQARQDLQKLYYDKSSRDLPEVYPGDTQVYSTPLITNGNLVLSRTENKHRNHILLICPAVAL